MLAVSVLLLMLVPTLNAQTLRQEIIAQLRDRDLEAALDTLGDVVDQGIVLKRLRRVTFAVSSWSSLSSIGSTECRRAV